MKRLRPLLFFFVALVSGFSPGSARAGYYPSLYTATRANAMGGAFVAVADDEEAIFMNPAGLAGIRGLSLNYAAADLEVSTDTIALGVQGSSAFSNLSPATLNKLMGKNIYTGVQFAPSLVMPNFGVSVISNGQFGLFEQNQANPNMGLAYQITNGAQAAMGFSVLPRYMRVHGDLRVGVAVKMLWRQGGYYNLDFLDTLQFSSDPVDKLHAMIGPYSRGIGVDVGTQYLVNVGKNLILSAALVGTDLGDTAFSDPVSQPIKSNITWGVAATYRLRKLKAILDFDYTHLLQDQDFGSKSHLGLELQMPFISIQGGMDQLALSYGASFDIWIMRISAASYAQQLDAYAGQDIERRYALRIAFKFGF